MTVHIEQAAEAQQLVTQARQEVEQATRQRNATIRALVEAGVAQSDIAKVLGVSPQLIGVIVNEGRPKKWKRVPVEAGDE